ncbi:MAG: citramalate synthase [Christensenellaceae bacterium]|nr:citramalate synthase [Christensenellaceae bacterium]
MTVELLDSTLREGAQMEGISFSIQDKIDIFNVLSDLGIAYIEAGNPFSNPKDAEFFEKASALQDRGSKLCAFSSTRAKDVKADEDGGIAAVISSGASCAVIFGKAHAEQVDKVLKVSKEENLNMIRETIEYIKGKGLKVIFDAEHYFDGFVYDREYALETVRTAEEAGADVVCLCDSNGGTSVTGVSSTVSETAPHLKTAKLGVHIHNDSDCAVAASIAAVEAGATHVQGSFNGYGERCGIARLTSVIADLQLKKGIGCIAGDIKDLTPSAIRIAEIANNALPRSTPYVGRSAFAHKAGMHIDAMDKLEGAFEHIDPESVGNKRKILLSEVSGRRAVTKKLTGMFPGLKEDSSEIESITEELKNLERDGYQFEGADASFYLMASKKLNNFKQHFTTVHYRTSGEFPALSDNNASAFVQINVDGKEETGAALGNGPVNALDKALRKALAVFYPSLMNMKLIDYKVRVLSPKEATGAVVRVLVTTTDGSSSWTTVGVSSDIIKASFIALTDSIEYFLAGR